MIAHSGPCCTTSLQLLHELFPIDINIHLSQQVATVVVAAVVGTREVVEEVETLVPTMVRTVTVVAQ